MSFPNPISPLRPLLLALGCAVLACSDGANGVDTPPVVTCDPGTGTPPAADVTVTVNATVRRQTIEGFGTTERLFDDPHVTETFNAATQRAAVVVPAADQARILDALYVELGLNRLRWLPEDGTEPVNDNADPEVTDLSKFNFAWKHNDGHIELVKAVRPRGVTTFFASPVNIELWMSETNPREYVEWAMAFLRRWRAQGVEMPYYSVMNEPGYARQQMSGAYMREVIKLLGAKLKAEGFRTRLVVPDDLNASRALERLQVILPDAEARQHVGAIAYHLYGGGDREAVKRLAEQYQIPVWMTEYFESDWLGWGRTMHDMLADYDATAVDYMWGFFGQWTNGQLIVIRHSGNSYTGFERTKHYYATGQYSRFVKPGAVRIGTTVSSSAVRASSFVEDRTVTIVALNQEGTARSARFDIAAAPGCPSSASAVRTSDSESWASLPAIAVTGGRFVATLPPRSMTTFVVR